MAILTNYLTLPVHIQVPGTLFLEGDVLGIWQHSMKILHVTHRRVNYPVQS